MFPAEVPPEPAVLAVVPASQSALHPGAAYIYIQHSQLLAYSSIVHDVHTSSKAALHTPAGCVFWRAPLALRIALASKR